MNTYTQGLRRSEFVTLTLDDVDFDKIMISEKRSKTEAGIRVVPIPPDLIVELNKMSGKRKGYVFKTKLGTQYKNNLLKRFKECLKRSGIKPK
ncbi:MAG: tyrosine-type recombinase/integrase [Deltaproteobacteria bacterium]|nr:tyrosine-type recombinase/integrase [Deltaproteobacteria bacterium]